MVYYEKPYVIDLVIAKLIIISDVKPERQPQICRNLRVTFVSRIGRGVLASVTPWTREKPL